MRGDEGCSSGQCVDSAAARLPPRPRAGVPHVENHDRWRLSTATGRSPLLLATGEPIATFAEDRVQPVGQALHLSLRGHAQGDEQFGIGCIQARQHQVRAVGAVGKGVANIGATTRIWHILERGACWQVDGGRADQRPRLPRRAGHLAVRIRWVPAAAPQSRSWSTRLVKGHVSGPT